MLGFLTAIPTDLVVTVGLCFLEALSIAIIMRFFVKPAMKKLDTYMESKVGTDTKAYAVFATIKNYIYLVVAAVLTLVFLLMLMKVAVFPCNNSKALVFLYFIPVFALQFFLDTHMRKLACKCFGFPYEEEEEETEKVAKPKVYTVAGQKYTKDENENLVPYTAG